MIPTLRLGSSELTCSRLAYGCWRIAEGKSDAENLALARAAVDAALDAGYTLFDHADIYCHGLSEEVFGRVLQERPGLRERMVIATKCGIRFAGDGGLEAPYRYDSSAEHIIHSCEASLRRLRLETIDLYQIHRPDFLMHPEEVALAFDRLWRAGKVREFGVSNFRPAQVELLQQACARPLVAQQIEMSLLQQAPLADGTLDQCLRLRLTPLAWSPLGAGLLGEGAKSLLPSQRGYQPESTLEELERLAQARGTSRIAIAVAWLLKHPAGIVPIIGSTRAARIAAAAAALEVDLSRDEWYRLLVASRGAPLP